jgi:hypothetical protein
MTGAELTALLSAGKTIKLGGAGEGYAGTLTLHPDGTGSGTAKTDAGEEITLTGSWRIKDDTFCRKWEGRNEGKEICEVWVYTGPKKVNVLVEGEKIGVNSW